MRNLLKMAQLYYEKTYRDSDCLLNNFFIILRIYIKIMTIKQKWGKFILSIHYKYID